MPKASVKRFIECKKEQLIDLVLDIEKYPDFVPFCMDAKVHEKKEQGDLLLIIADLTIGKGPFKDTYKSDVKFNKKNEFIIYVGSHGDNGAELADIILPGAAYTEQSGHYTNLEGKLQKAYKASYPPGDAKEDWEIINDLAEFMNNRKLFNDKDELESSMFNYINLKKEKQESPSNSKVDLSDFEDEILKITYKEYYFSNVIARASKTMLNCNNSKLEVKRTGTEG